MSATLSGLSQATTYHYGVVASNGYGTGYGADGSFSTTSPGAAPFATTGAATSVSQSGATLNGAVNPNYGTIIDCHFEYGASAAYGSSAPCPQNVGGGGTSVAVSADLNGLLPGITYHYRLVAASARGTSDGVDTTFMTAAAALAPAVTTSAASAVAGTGATLNGIFNPNGGVVSDCHFDYGTTTAYGGSALQPPHPTPIPARCRRRGHRTGPRQRERLRSRTRRPVPLRHHPPLPTTDPRAPQPSRLKEPP